MRAECANCHSMKERHWNHNKTLLIGRCDDDKGHGKNGNGRLTIAADPTVIKKVPCKRYKPIDPNWTPPPKEAKAKTVRNGVKEQPSKGKKKVRA